METVKQFEKGRMYFRSDDDKRDLLFFPTDDVFENWTAFTMVPLVHCNHHYQSATTGGLLPQEERKYEEPSLEYDYTLADDEGIEHLFRVWNSYGQEEFTLRYFMERVREVDWLLDEEKSRLEVIYKKVQNQE